MSNEPDPYNIKEVNGKIVVECELPLSLRGHDEYKLAMVHHPTGGGAPVFEYIAMELFNNGTMFRFEVDHFSSLAILHKDKKIVPNNSPTVVKPSPNTDKKVTKPTVTNPTTTGEQDNVPEISGLLPFTLSNARLSSTEGQSNTTETRRALPFTGSNMRLPDTGEKKMSLLSILGGICLLGILVVQIVRRKRVD
jgi:LPXTG-motif cell wall-anchored protein